MAEGAWSQSECRSDVWWWGVSGQGCWYWTARFGERWVGAPHGMYALWNYECGPLGAPVKDYGWLSEFAAFGQWFEGGAIFWRNGRWNVVLGNWGQTAGRSQSLPEGFTADGFLLVGPEAPEPPESENPPSVPERA